MLLESVKSSGDPAGDTGVYKATMKERDKGFLKGPIDAQGVPTGGTLTRRFGVLQRDKVRPINDYKASLVNSSVTRRRSHCRSGVGLAQVPEKSWKR